MTVESVNSLVHWSWGKIKCWRNDYSFFYPGGDQEGSQEHAGHLEGLCLSAGAVTYWAPPRGAGGGDWLKRSLGVSAEDADHFILSENAKSFYSYCKLSEIGFL